MRNEATDASKTPTPSVTRRAAIMAGTAAVLAPAVATAQQATTPARAGAAAPSTPPYVDGQVPGTPGPGEVVSAYGAPRPKAPVAPLRVTRRPVGPKDVQVDVLWTGICHTDIHFVDNDTKASIYPCVPGHEVAGRVSAVGAEVTRHKVGDTVAMGPIVGHCGKCPNCGDGLEQYCTGPSMTHMYNGPILGDGTNTYGGYSARMVVGEPYAFAVPANLDLKGVPSILCAGLTTYSPLKHWKVGPGKAVGVVGMGGLGHMAVKLASAMGADVTVFSSSPEKEADAMKFGAKAFVPHKDAEAMKKHAGTLDLVLCLIPTAFDVNPFVSLVKRDGTLVTVGHLSSYAMPTDNGTVAMQRRSMAGSFIGSLAESRELLKLCGERNITATVQPIRMAEVNEAYPRIKSGKVRYRYVIDVANSL